MSRDGAGGLWPGREIDPGDSERLLEEALDRLFRGGSRGGSIYTLEVGCGDGRASRLVFQHLTRACGSPAVRLCVLDIDMERVVEASHRLRGETRGGLRVIRGDMYRLPFPAEGFHFVVALNVFFWAEKQRLLAEAARVLKPEGKLLICDLLPRPAETKRPLITLLMSREQVLAPPTDEH